MPSILSTNQVRFTILATLLAFLYRILTQRAPLLFLSTSTPPALPSPNTCTIHHASLLHNCEDFSHLPNTPYIFLSCDSARREWSHAFGAFPPGAAVGEIYLWNHETPFVAPVLVSDHSSLGGDFHPLGLSATALNNSTARVFITNQAKNAKIEVLDVELVTGTSTHSGTITDGRIHSPNGITAYNSTSFYVSNDLYMARRWPTAVLAEALLGLPGGQVLFVSLPTQPPDPEIQIFPIARVCFANGLAFDPIGSTLYIASSTHGIYTYSIPSEPWSAHPLSFHRTPFAPDNIMFSHSQRALYVSGISSLSATTTAMMSAEAPGAPSWSIELLPELPRNGVEKHEKALRAVDLANWPLRDGERRWRSVFMDDGTTFGGVSTGGVVGSVYVGVSMTQDGVIVCTEVLERRGSLPTEAAVGKDEL